MYGSCNKVWFSLLQGGGRALLVCCQYNVVVPERVGAVCRALMGEVCPGQVSARARARALCVRLCVLCVCDCVCDTN